MEVFMGRILKKIFATASILTVLTASSFSYASTIDDWDIYYIPNAPASVSNQHDNLYVAYCSDGYDGYCYSISGSNGRGLTITAENAGGLYNDDVSVTTTGYTAHMRTKNTISSDVHFKVTAKYGYSCDSTGSIYIHF